MRSNSWNLKFAFRYSFVRSTHRILREGSSSKIKICVSLQRRAIKNFQMRVLLQRCAQKCMKFAFRYSFARSTHRILREGSSSKIKICVSLQWRASKNFQMYVLLQRRAQKCMKFAFRYSFARSTHRIREGSSSKIKMCASRYTTCIQKF